MRAPGVEVYRRLEAFGLLAYVQQITVEEFTVAGTIGLRAVVALRQDRRFIEGGLWWLHRHVGEHLTEFRSDRGAEGPGSMQLVIDLETGAFEADIDLSHPYDLVGAVWHFFGDMMPSWLRRKPSEPA